MLVWWLFKIKLITLIWSAAEHKLPFLFLPTHQPNKFSPHKKRQSSPQTVEVFRPRLYFIYFVLLCVTPNVKWTLLMHWFRWFDNWKKGPENTHSFPLIIFQGRLAGTKSLRLPVAKWLQWALVRTEGGGGMYSTTKSIIFVRTTAQWLPPLDHFLCM